ncbi:MAG: neutral/alkaline non-lysosomal ceramidase N-terminal domain-containing protein [Candidatus Alcyoniella australis]|nr:neutral/alkaline non-lysosomal ceramidase N-terminal domain-containing protein [Candidatus Alcyoniella australis]
MAKRKDEFRAGAAAVRITPTDLGKCYLAGFAPNRICRGVLDPLWARALYISDGSTELALVACDLIGLSWQFVQQIRSRISGIDQHNVLIHCTHTHSGPDTMGLWGKALGELPLVSGIDPQYMDSLFDEIAFAVNKARINARPAVAYTAVDRTDRAGWVENIREPNLIDEQMTLLRLDDLAGRTIATLVNFGCHPETLWDRNHLLSPDYPAQLLTTVESALGGVGLFVSGALGGMVTPALTEDTSQARRREFTVELGTHLGQCAVDALQKARKVDAPSIDYRRAELLLPFENKLLAFMSNMGVLGERRPEGGRLRTEVAAIRLGPLGAITMPGETLPAVGLAAKELLDCKHKMLFSLCNDELGYILPESDFGNGLYEYESKMSVGPHTAPELLGALASLIAD